MKLQQEQQKNGKAAAEQQIPHRDTPHGRRLSAGQPDRDQPGPDIRAQDQ